MRPEIIQFWCHQPSDSFDDTTVDDVTDLNSVQKHWTRLSFDYTMVGDVSFYGNDVDMPTSCAS